MVASGSKQVLPREVLGLNHRDTLKMLKDLLLQNHLAQMLEMWYVALPGVLYQVRSNEGPMMHNGPYPRDTGFEP